MGAEPRRVLAVDEIGVGGGVIDRLVQLGVSVQGFNASRRAPRPDRFLNLRASAFWQTRELFRLGEIDIDPADRQLADELATVTYSLDAAGRIVIGDKAKMAKSPDRADALVVAAWANDARAGHEQLMALLEERARASDPLLTGTKPIAEVDWNGARHGSWRERLDPDLPEFR